jgi:thymidylate synthase
MSLPITPQKTNAQAWLAAVLAIRKAGGDAHNVIVDIADPLAVENADAEILTAVDKFLRAHNVHPLATIANTIFPQALLEKHGPEKFYKVYAETVLPRARQMTHDWGRYFERMTMWKKLEGNKIVVMNPLADLVALMKSQIEKARTYRNIYEMTIYDPVRDAGKVAGRQCLSFLSFKLDKKNALSLTAVYRNHHYIARTLGNFLGLGHLQAFVAKQSGATLGSLTIVSTHAEIDSGKNKDGDVVRGWASSEAEALIETCAKLGAP